MSWTCVGCSEHHLDDLDIKGFGLCKACATKVKEEKAAVMAAKAKKHKQKR